MENEITEALTKDAARSSAADKATDFVVDLAPDAMGEGADFTELAKKYELTIEELDPFASDEKIADLDVGLTFNDAGFRLRRNPDEYFSDAIPGEDYVYVITLKERFEAYVPEFSEVEEEVRVAAEAVALQDALIEKAQDFQEAVTEGLSKDKTFADIADSYGLTAVTVTNITAASGIEDSEYSDLLMRAILVRNQGELTETIPADGALLLAYVITREPGDLTAFASLKPRITQMLRQDRARYLFEEWQEYLLREAHFVPRVIPKVPDYEEDEYYEDEEDIDTEESPIENDTDTE